MPTRRSRISVVRDPELSLALETAREHLTAGSEAGRLRELAIIGARELTESSESRPSARGALLQMGAMSESSDLVASSRRVLARADQTARENDQSPRESATESLEWVRGER